MSTNTGFALSRAMLPAVATKVKGEVMTSSPESTPSAIRASNNASDPDAQPRANRQPTRVAISASSSLTGGPMMNCWLSRTLSTAARISAFIVAYSALRSRNGNRRAGARCSVGDGGWVSDDILKLNYSASEGDFGPTPAPPAIRVGGILRTLRVPSAQFSQGATRRTLRSDLKF